MVKDINNIDPRLLEEDDRIVAFLKGQTSQDEEQQFLKELEANPEMKERAIATARLLKGMKEVGTEQDKSIQGAFLASSKEGVEGVAKEAVRQRSDDAGLVHGMKKTPFVRRTSSWMAIAASLVFIIWFGLEYRDYRSTTGLGEEYGSAFSSGVITRGTDTSSEAEKKLGSLFANIKNSENLDAAIHELSLCWELSTMETYNDYTDYSAEIGWNLAIAYLKDNNKKDAKTVLEKLITTSEEGSAIHNTSKQLLEEL